jgi:hypothetical protein
MGSGLGPGEPPKLAGRVRFSGCPQSALPMAGDWA